MSRFLEESQGENGNKTLIPDILFTLHQLIPLKPKDEDTDPEMKKRFEVRLDKFTENEFTQLSQSVLPHCFSLFESNNSHQTRSYIISLIEKLIVIIPGSHLKSYLRPYQFSSFVIELV